MALVLLRLRLTIARRSRGASNGARLYFATAWVVGAVGGLLAALGTAALLSGSGYGDLLLLAAFGSIFIPWVIGPIVEPTLADGVVDPQRLEQFPLTGAQQVAGLFAGALVSPTALFTFLFAVGGLLAPGQPVGLRLVSLVVGLTYTPMCVGVSRAAQAMLAGALRSRRGSDLAAFGASLLVLAVYIFAQQARSATAAMGGQSASGPLGTVLSWTPPGAAARALLSARDGDWIDVALRLGIVTITLGLSLAAWAWVLSRRVDGVSVASRSGRRRREASELPLTPALLRSLPPGPTLAAMSQQLRYFFLRSPRAIQTLVIPPVMGIVVAHASFAEYGLAAQTAAFAAMSVVAGSFNLFGYDGQGFTYFVLGGAPLRQVIVGKALAPLVYLVPLVVAFGATEAVIRDEALPTLVASVLAGCSVVALGLGVGSLASVLNPSDQSRVGQRRGSFLKVFGWFMSFFLATSVGGVLWWGLASLAGEVVAALAMLAATIALGRALLRWSGRRLEGDPYRVMRKLDPRSV